MDIKLKNSPRATTIITVVILLICSIGMVLVYPVFSREMKEKLDGNYGNTEQMADVAYELIGGNYILYNEKYGETNRADILANYGSNQFDLLRKYMDYELFDESGEALLDNADKAILQNLKKKDGSPYAMRVSFTFQEEARLSDINVSGNLLDETEQYTIEQYLLQTESVQNRWSDISSPSKVQIVYGITEGNLKDYLENNVYSEQYPVYELLQNNLYKGFVKMFIAVLAGLAIVLTMKKSSGFGVHKIFAFPFEGVLIVFFMLIYAAYFPTEAVWLTINGGLAREVLGVTGLLNVILSFVMNAAMWFILFGIVFWGFVCLSGVFTMKREYWIRRTLCNRLVDWYRNKGSGRGDKYKENSIRFWSKVGGFCKRQYHVLQHLDFQDKTNSTILKIVVINFLLLLVVCSLWFYGVGALIIYSVALFLFLRKYFQDVRKKYELLLCATNQLAEGDLDTPINGDMGVFQPIQKELRKIQDGFKKAVEEEVKSERMKTELISNVSHDLKTPLTAIITYTDLLKNESDEEKRREYVSVLERKSLRLKVLIEDLFEISKASSRNVTMNFMDIDIVDLLKQVGLEHDSKIKETSLDFRWNLPDSKIVLWLDSQKTYRIFENLIMNIIKYAMPHTRVYVDMKELNGGVFISMKNISSTELNFNTEEITDRFVRGDASRNTEGSGLGLAIAKSFTELQHGTLEITTEADLFKAVIVLPSREAEPELAQEPAQE